MFKSENEISFLFIWSWHHPVFKVFNMQSPLMIIMIILFIDELINLVSMDFSLDSIIKNVKITIYVPALMTYKTV